MIWILLIGGYFIWSYYRFKISIVEDRINEMEIERERVYENSPERQWERQLREIDREHERQEAHEKEKLEKVEPDKESGKDEPNPKWVKWFLWIVFILFLRLLFLNH